MLSPATYAARRTVRPTRMANSGSPVTSTASLKVTVISMASPGP